MRTVWPLLLILVALVGCKSSEPAADEKAAPEWENQARPKVSKGEEKKGTLSEPWEEKPGTPKGQPDEPPHEVVFKAPKKWPTPVAPDERPRLPRLSGLALVLVSKGKVHEPGKVLVQLEGLLEEDDALAMITGLATPHTRQVTLESLARLAYKAGRHLLLIDFRPGLGKNRIRDGYLLYTKTATVLAAWSIKKGQEPSDEDDEDSGEVDLDLCDRVGLAYARLKK